jgi:methylated-DNA-[protein]-cysteine S-methyltransferase
VSRRDYDAILTTPFGALGVVAQETLTSLDFLPARIRPLSARTALAREVCAQLRMYLANPRHVFDLPVQLHGSVYQQRAWRALVRIPCGSVISYGQLAAKLNSGARAIGGACRANPVPIVIPCHRVVSAYGLGGFMGGRKPLPLAIKQWLLAHERAG